MSYSKELSGVLIRYLMFTCSEEIVGLVGHETSLASVLAVLNVLLSSVDCAHALIIEGKDFAKTFIIVTSRPLSYTKAFDIFSA